MASEARRGVGWRGRCHSFVAAARCRGRQWVLVSLIAAAAGAPAADSNAAAFLHASRTTVPFGYISQGYASPVQAVFITNTGDAALAITALTLEGAQPGDFAVAASGTCGASITLNPS